MINTRVASMKTICLRLGMTFPQETGRNWIMMIYFMDWWLYFQFPSIWYCIIILKMANTKETKKKNYPLIWGNLNNVKYFSKLTNQDYFSSLCTSILGAWVQNSYHSKACNYQASSSGWFFCPITQYLGSRFREKYAVFQGST